MFLNPLMLIGVGAAVMPFVLHLLSRSRYKDVDWGAMMFLRGAEVRRRQSARFTQILLLLLRSAVIALLAVALARPMVQSKFAGPESEGRMTAALLLDCSGSMGFDENGRTRFQMAQAAARQIIRGLRPGDRVALILMGGPRQAEPEPTGDLGAIEAQIDDAKVGYGRANIAESLETAANILSRYEKTARDVYVVCDRQALSWESVDAQAAADWRRRMRSTVMSARMFVLPVGSADADNIAVESVRLTNPPAIARQPTGIEVVVRNYGKVQHAAIPVSIDGVSPAVPQRSISLAAGQSTSVPFNVVFSEPGSQVISAKVKSGGYTGDNQLDMVVNVIPPIRVLVISGDEQQGQVHGASDYLGWALAPHHANGKTGGDPCTVTVVPAEQWTEADLRKHQVVILANVERFTPEQRTAIEKYVFVNGGRLLIAPGSLSRVDNYNAQFYREGGGILPAMLMPPTAADGSESTSLLGMESDHPVFQFLRDGFEVPSATISRYFPAIPRQVDSVVLARYLNNDPFLIEGRSENGRVLLMTTALDNDWTTLPGTNFYLPYVQSAVRYLASFAVPEGNLTPGKVIQLKFDDTGVARTVMLTRPDGHSQKIDVIVRPEKQPEVRYGDTETPGTYRLQVQEGGKTQTVYFIVRPPREESDLSQLPEDRWQSLERSLGFTRVDPTTHPLMEALAANREGQELWGFALGSVLVLAVIEMLVARIGSVQARKQEQADELEPAKPHEVGTAL